MKKKTSSQPKSSNNKKLSQLPTTQPCEAISVSSLKPTTGQQPIESKKNQSRNNAPPVTEIYGSPLDDIELTDEDHELMKGYSDEHKRLLHLVAEIIVSSVLEECGYASSTHIEQSHKAKINRKKKKGGERN